MDYCKVCAHPEVAAITADLVARVPYRTIAPKYSVSIAALSRHVVHHIPETLRRQAARERNQPDAEPVLVQMRKLNQRALAVLQQAEDAKDRGLVLHAVRECRRNLELIAKLTGELDPRVASETAGGQVSVIVTYVDKQIAVSQAAAPHLLEDGEGD